MDVLQFLAPGYNLSSFFKAFDTSEQKSWLPYESLKDATQLPPYEAFYSTNKHGNVLNEEFAAYEKLISIGKSSDDALKVLKLRELPRSDPRNYQWLQQQWYPQGWSTLADYLCWYNSLDVSPMTEAIEKMNLFFQQQQIDFLHQAISLPGIAMHHFFNSIHDHSVEFHHFSHHNKEIYKRVKDSIIGGPSVMFN